MAPYKLIISCSMVNGSFALFFEKMFYPFLKHIRASRRSLPATLTPLHACGTT
jgi:hypothetical protein